MKIFIAILSFLMVSISGFSQQATIDSVVCINSINCPKYVCEYSTVSLLAGITTGTIDSIKWRERIWNGSIWIPSFGYTTIGTGIRQTIPVGEVATTGHAYRYQLIVYQGGVFYPAFADLYVSTLLIPTLTASHDTICTGTKVLFTAPTGGTNYQFKVNGVSKQNGTANIFTDSLLMDHDSIIVTMTNIGGCVKTSKAIGMTVNAFPNPTFSVSPNDTVCAGTSLTFSANGGSVYNFKVNGISKQNGTDTIFMPATLINKQIITVDVTNANGCVKTSKGITMIINPIPNLTFSVSPNDTVCAGTQVIFTAGGGATYDFRVNDTTRQNSTNKTFTTSTLVDHDTLIVIATSASGCVKTSAPIDITVYPLPIVKFSAITGTVYTNTPPFDLVDSATPKGGIFTGPGMKGSIFDPAKAGTGTHTIMYFYAYPITGCSTSQIQHITVGVNGIDENKIITIIIFPNPANEQVNLTGIDTKNIQRISIVNVVGKVVYTTTTIIEHMHINISNYVSGAYIINFITPDGVSMGKWFMKQ